MDNTNSLIRDYSHSAFQTVFHRYFDEMGIAVNNWPGLFDQMTDDAEPTFLRKDENGRIIGFIQFTKIIMTSWFFEDRCGFIREFWVDPSCRSQGHGTALLNAAENWLRKQGLCRVLLTTDTAEVFYLRHGYLREESMIARNNAPVYVKLLE